MSTRSGFLLLIGFGALCMFLAALALAVSFLFFSRRSVNTALTLPTWNDPAKVDNLKIDPILSVSTLAGTPELTAISAMQARGEIDAAYAATIYATSLSDRQRLGQLLLIGERYTAAENVSSAKLTYQAVIDTVALSAVLSDFERTEALAQVATALYKLRDTNLAGLTLDAGRDITLQSPFLKSAHRVALLNQLLRAAQKGGDDARIKKLNEDRSNFVDVSEPAVVAATEPPNPVPAIDAPAKNDQLSAAQAKRVAAAQKIAQLSVGTPVRDELIEELGNALFSEDDVRLRAYSVPTGQVALPQKIALQRALVDWLTLKYRIARKAFGISIVPEWEDSESEIRSQLAKAYENLYVLRTEQAVALPQTRDIALAGSYLLRQQILAGRMGLYPGFPENSLTDELNDKTDELIGSQPNSTLRVKVETSGDKYYYHLVNDDSWYGPPEAAQATPSVKPKVTAAPTRAVASPTAAAGTKSPAAPTANATPGPTQAQAPPTNTPVPPPTNTAVAPRPTPLPTRPYP